jgi:predicted DNA-binding protein
MATQDSRLHVPLPNKLHKRLKALSTEEQRSMAAIVRLALEDRIRASEIEGGS